MKVNLKFILATIGVAVLMQLNTVVYADESYSVYGGKSYSAVATSSEAVGFYLGAESRNKADAKAIEWCHTKSKSQCNIVDRFRGPACGAIAEDSDGVGLGWGVIEFSGYLDLVSGNEDREQAAQSQAQNLALNECNSRSSGCRVTTTACYPTH